ncbi:MAG TPA: NYN domain-containing protein [Brumimicrobium sp.]|nr:NYN domain-containing protein [Brumimicrobium sp.]
MENDSKKIAILVDGDNAQAKLLGNILEEVSKYGKVTIRRIYGDWTIPQMNSWKDLLNDLSFTPIQKFNYTTGKNSTDSSLIIDAMDILYGEKVDGFCIVSSDSDYTGLAKRIRESGIFVMGIGEKKTPNAFVQSCEIFTYTETLTSDDDEEEDATKTRKTTAQKGKAKKEDGKLYKKELKLIDKAFDMSVGEDDETYISVIGANLRKLNSSFDARNYGFRNLTELFRNIKTYEVIDNHKEGVKNRLVRRKSKS